MFRTAVFLLLASISIDAFGCQCANRIGSNFLNQVKRFDLIVIGVYERTNSDARPVLHVLKSFKGSATGTRLKLVEGGLDCGHALDFSPGDTILIGLHKSPYKGDENSFMAGGCATSALRIQNGNRVRVYSKFVMPAIRKQRIGLFSTEMRLAVLEKRMKRKIS